MHYSKLRIYRLAKRLRNELHQELKLIPFGWKIGAVDQAKRSSSSAVSNIAEGQGNRFYTKKYIHYLNIALGSSDETQNHIDELCQNRHIGNEKAAYFLNKYKTLSIQTLNLINFQRENYLN